MYLGRGWVAPLPCDFPRPGSVPGGFSGYNGVDPNQSQVDAWIATPDRGNANLGLRMQDGTLGIDVDCHDGKRGCELLEYVEQFTGQLPKTWYSTARNDGSRHLMYRVPRSMEWKSEITEKIDGVQVKGIEILRPHHRWARAWPSLNPKTGQPIHWYTPEGVVSTVPPRPDDLAELPSEWVDYLKSKERGERGTFEFTDEKFNWSQFNVEDDSIPEGNQNELLFKALSSARAGSKDALTFLAVQLVRKFEGVPEHPKGDWDAKSILGVVDQVVKYAPGTSVVVAPELKQWAQQVDAAVLDGWLDVTELDRLVTPSYLVKGLLDRPVVALLHGDGGVGKSFMSLDVALHVALGREWRGARVRQARVAYVYTEGPAYATRRVHAWCKVNESPLDDLKGRLLVYPRPLDLLGPSEPLEAFATWVQKAGVGLVVFDTFRRNTVGGDENSAKDVSKALHWASRVVQSDATCLIIHHDNKSGGYSGNTALHGHVDTRIHLTRHEHDESVICVESEKERESARAGVLYGRLESVQLGVDEDGDAFGSAVFVEAHEPQRVATPQGFVNAVKLEEEVQKLLDIVQRKPGCSTRHIRESLGVQVARAPYVIEVAVERGLIRVEDGPRKSQLHYEV
ncbi:AAA family ATPase [Lentzea flaviverrucosa]|uniref:Bifunctional DNA primase/polymerase, N-terminal n=1 Tax=Lentzea flaviverrucosa TaxID=200379 RepID=A0A1H9XA35_9PSEU|nr:AAA family ATPase [Lentzea flaviverrucosa]RDI21710.1 bifunctional DNA primase/polymerase-like protein [Lentzea flaviverrucosa]SES42964.1 Bifunctional DNA primase/polymerase, N-terminal [Lentzea flaviverrucosa]